MRPPARGAGAFSRSGRLVSQVTLLVGVCLTTLHGSYASTGPLAQDPSPGLSGPPAAPPGTTWQRAFFDDFDGTGLDRSKLSPCFDWNTGDCTSSFNRGRESYRPEQVVVGGGVARLKAQPAQPTPNPACLGGDCSYHSAMLSTARATLLDGSRYLYQFRYGYAEARLRIPSTQGFLGAFWLIPADRSYHYEAEIDVAEALGHDPRTVHMTYHYDQRTREFTQPGPPDQRNGSCPDLDYSADYHRYGVDWEPDHIAWYIDGRKCLEFDEPDLITNQPMQLVVNLMVDPDWVRQVDAPLADPAATDELDVDYLVVYEPSYDGPSATGASTASIGLGAAGGALAAAAGTVAFSLRRRSRRVTNAGGGLARR
jgi:beta-glucanase (GH16 family)